MSELLTGFDLCRAAMAVPGVTGPERSVLLVLAIMANDEGQAWPPISGDTGLTSKCVLSERAVQRAIKSLCAAGHLQRKQLRHGVIYTVTLAAQLTPATQTGVSETGATETPDSQALTPATQAPKLPVTTNQGGCVASTREADPISVLVADKLTGNRIAIAVWLAMLTEARDSYLLETSVVRWNEMAIRAGLATAKSLTPERRKRLRARLAEHGPDAFTEAIAAVERSSFCRGESAGGWRADFDFLLQASSFTKLIEGSYDRASRNRAAGRTGSGGREDPIFAARRNLGRDGFAGMDATEGTA